MANPYPQPAPFSNVPSKDDIANNRKLALALMGQATDTSPVGHWTQALARAVQGGVGGMHQAAASQGEKARQGALVQALAGSGSFGSLGAGERAILASNPALLESVAGKVIGGKLDPNAGIARETAGLKLQALREELAMNREMAPLRRRQLEAQIRQLEQKDEMSGIVGALLKGAMPQGGQSSSSAPTQGQGGFQPQSYTPPPSTPGNAAINASLNEATGGGVASQPNTDPLLIPTQAGAGVPQAGNGPQPQPGATSQGGDTVPTPLGPMSLDQAQKLGFALGLAGKGDAGKIFIDAASANKLDKTARGEVEKDLVGLTNTIGRLESISKRFDPKFLNIPQRAGMAWAGLQDKFGSLPPETKADLERYTKFRQTAVQNAALYVKYLSGVAVAEAEFNRIMKTLPNAGTGIFDGDSPTEFQAKMNEATTQAKMAYARAMYLRTQGFKGKPWEAGIALDDMGDIIRQRGAELQQQLQGRIAPDRMQTTVRQKLKQEFGI